MANLAARSHSQDDNKGVSRQRIKFCSMKAPIAPKRRRAWMGVLVCLGTSIPGINGMVPIAGSGVDWNARQRVKLRRAEHPRSRALLSIEVPRMQSKLFAVEPDAGAVGDPMDEQLVDGHPAPSGMSRRRLLQASASTALATAATFPNSAWAGKPELDSSGQLFSPKSEMMSGGSQAARGISIERTAQANRRGDRLQPGQILQSVYETRFIAYLSRFLLNFDPAAHAWWVKQGVGDTWDEITQKDKRATVETIFAEFAESVEIGLGNYFVGPYGSYSSLSAMKAGLAAEQPARSKRPIDAGSRRGFFGWEGMNRNRVSEITNPSRATEIAKQGILNLYTLLKARYTSMAAKRQLAILFSFISSPELQPTPEISGLLGEADNVTVSSIQVFKEYVLNEADSRTSSRRGGGYSVDSFPIVTVEPPPALGGAYLSAQARPRMQTTSRVLKVVVTDPGEGYTEAPPVRILQNGIRRACQATAILDRSGHVESVLVLDPGYGYGGRKDAPPQVQIEPPPRPQRDVGGILPSTRPAKAVAFLEYEIEDIELTRGGNGYVRSEPPVVQISPPVEDPDWYINVQEQPELRMVPIAEKEGIRAAVTEMKLPDGNVAYSIAGIPTPKTQIDDALLDRLQRDPLELLPSSVRPQLRQTPARRPLYTVPVLDTVPQVVAVLSPRYRAYDPVFGGVGKIPVTKGALELSAGEYARLALSGAVCTVVVRTLLNPLELVKTKQQLKNDPELLDYLSRKRRASVPRNPEDIELIPSAMVKANSLPLHQNDGVTTLIANPTQAIAEATAHQPKDAAVGTIDMLRGIAELRGPWALFQSADATFLASLAFGSFGFGATELFRRSFTAVFFSGDDTAESVSSLVLLLAAALATVVTAAVAAPFELLRVRSMGLRQAMKWTSVLQDFVVRTIASLPLIQLPTVHCSP